MLILRQFLNNLREKIPWSISRCYAGKLNRKGQFDDTNCALREGQFLTANDWNLIPKVVALLKPFADVTKDAEKEFTTLSEVIPQLKIIKHGTELCA